jgi:hypothetical protein
MMRLVGRLPVYYVVISRVLLFLPSSLGALIASEPLQIGARVDEPGIIRNRRLLQITCPVNMILQDGQWINIYRKA